MKHFYCLLAVLLCAGCTDQSIKDHPTSDPPLHDQVEDIARLSSMGDAEYVIDVFTRPYDAGRDTGVLWGAEGGATTVVHEITVTRQNLRVFVPRSAFADLANPQEAELSIVDSHKEVIVRGGDEGSGYECRIVLVADQVIRRIISSRTFPENYKEVTEYTNRAPDN